MGCDYYIDKNLHLYDYNDAEISYINVEHERGYYWFDSLLDEDDDEYEAKYAEHIKQTLEPSAEPIVIYSNNKFNKFSSENKYKTIIETELKLYNKTLNDVKEVKKVETRYER